MDSAGDSHFYILGPILVNNNNSDLVNLEPVAPVVYDAAPQIAPSPQVVDRLPLPVGGHVLHFQQNAIDSPEQPA